MPKVNEKTIFLNPASPKEGSNYKIKKRRNR